MKLVHSFRETREYYLCLIYLMWWLALFRWATGRQTTISFANLSIIYLSRPFEDDFSVRYMLYYLAAYSGYVRGVRWQRLCATIIPDNFLHLCTDRWNSWKPYLFNPSKKLSYCGETFPNGCTKIYYSAFCSLQPHGNNLMFTVKSNNHCISALRNLVGRTYLMVTLKSNNYCISALCNLVGRTYLMVTLNADNHCISALCNLMGRIYLMVTLKSNNHCIFSL